MDNRKIIDKLLKLLEKDKHNLQTQMDLFDMCRAIEKEDFEYAHQINKLLRKVTQESAIMTQSTSHYLLFKRELLFDAPHDFDAYLLYVEFDREPSKKFYTPRRKILLSVVKALEDLYYGRLELLSISMPPGTGKSTLGIFFLSWAMGKEPDKPNLASAHSGMLTRSFYDGVLSIITDPDYLWHDVFPTVQLEATNSKEETIDLDKPHRFKSLTCRAIGASLTGATRAENILYADDLCSGIEEALSKDRLDKLWERYTNDLKSRKKLGCKELHIATRWSVHDVIGRLERMYSNDGKAKFITVPALDDKGESNFNYEYNVGFDKKYFEDMKKNLDDASFLALFMNQPIEREGILYFPDELQRYYELPNQEPDSIMAVVDTAEGGGDYTAMVIGYVYGERVYIEDVVYDNAKPEITDNLCASALVKNKVDMCRFESNSAGGRTADKINELVKQFGGHTHISKKRTTSNKLTKIIVNSSIVKEKFLFKDESTYVNNSPYGRFIRDVTSFTQMGKNKHDDAVDSLAQLVEYIHSMKANDVEVFKRPF